MAELVTKTDLAATKADLTTVIDNAVLRMTIRLGGIVAVGVGVLAVLDRLFH